VTLANDSVCFADESEMLADWAQVIVCVDHDFPTDSWLAFWVKRRRFSARSPSMEP